MFHRLKEVNVKLKLLMEEKISPAGIEQLSNQFFDIKLNLKNCLILIVHTK